MSALCLLPADELPVAAAGRQRAQAAGHPISFVCAVFGARSNVGRGSPKLLANVLVVDLCIGSPDLNQNGN